MSQPARAPLQGWSNEQFARVAAVAFTTAGLVFPANRQPSAESAMRRVMSAFHFKDVADLLAGVSHPGEARNALLAELTVGESYFFREAGALTVLERDVIGARYATQEAGPLRIWCAGCSTGEEPYTMAMLLRELGWPHPAQILGTDISRPRLDAARRGRYTQWSLRGVSPERIGRWFEQRSKHFIVRDDIRDAVRFQALNLVSDDYPSSDSGTMDQDLILCRNVLIYFDLPTVAQVAARLLRALRPGGWLLLGASDPPLGDLVECRTFMTPSGAVYQRADGEPRVIMAPMPVNEPWAGAWTASEPPVVVLQEGPRPHEVEPAIAPNEVPILPHDEAEQDASAHWVSRIRSLANEGRLEEAGEMTAGAIDRYRLDPELHYLHGMLLLERGHVAEGVQAARRALYLDRSFVIARMLLGDGLTRLGDVPGAQRAFSSVLRQIDAMPDGESVRAADGVPVSRVRQIAAERLRGLTVNA